MYLPTFLYNMKPWVILTGAGYSWAQDGMGFAVAAAGFGIAGLLIIRARGIL